MRSKTKEKEIAIALRREGKTYREVLARVSVAKSTLSLWLRSVNLSTPQRQHITQKRLDAGLRGGEKRKQERIRNVAAIRSAAASEVGRVTTRELWLIGAMLYWAEGAKQKEHNVSAQVRFGNSDPLMLHMFRAWLTHVGVPDAHVRYSIYLHENNKHRVDDVRRYWARMMHEPISALTTVYWKRNKPKTNRKNIGDGYFGVLRLTIRESTTLNRKISGWIDGVYCAFRKM